MSDQLGTVIPGIGRAKSADDIEAYPIGFFRNQTQVGRIGSVNFMGIATGGGKSHLEFPCFRGEDVIGPPKTFGRLDSDAVQAAQIAGTEKLTASSLIVEEEESVVRDS